MKAIRFNVEKQEVEQIDFNNSLESIYYAIGNDCGTFQIATYFEVLGKRIAILCDEEGRINNKPNGAIFLTDLLSFKQLICGNAILVGCDEDGELMDCPIDLELAKDMPHVFYSKEESAKFQL